MEKYLSEILTEIENVDPKIFNSKNELNDLFWDENAKLKPEIRLKLLKIVEQYIKTLKLPEDVDIIDIVFTGSLANFNYTKYSDVDVHIIIDYSKISDNKDFIESYFKDKKDMWSNRYDITIHGFPVELYTQDVNSSKEWTAIYSLLNDEWVQRPIKNNKKIDSTKIQSKVKEIETKINSIKEKTKDSNYDPLNDIEKIKNKIKTMRQSGLEEGGEYSTENLIFKVLRNSGVLDELDTIKTEYMNKNLSLKEGKKVKRLILTNKQIQSLKEILNNKTN